MTEIRVPQQLRSIETKKKIIEAGYDLFAKNGFYKTNTAQIAKEAGVSTGIVYGYFKNKKDILFEVIEIYNEKAYNPIFKLLDSISINQNLDNIITNILQLAEKLHKENYDIHKELNSIAQIDEVVNKTFIKMQDTITKKFVEKLKSIGYKKASSETIHISMNIIQSYVHECVYDKHEYLNYNKFKNEIVRLIKSLFD